MLSTIKQEKTLNRVLKINYLDEKQIEKILKYYKQEYIYIDNKIMFKSLYNQYAKIKNSFKTFDKPKKQKKMRLTVLETNINKLKEFGVKYNLSAISSNILNISVGNIVGSYTPTQTKNFGLDIKAMARDGVTKIVTNPVLTLRDKEKTTFNITRTIPTILSTQQIKDSKTEIVENIVYKSFGIKIDVTPVMNDLNNDLTLNINLQDILSNIGNKPETSDKLLVQKVIIKDNTTYLLSGFKKTLKVTNDDGVPILKDLPILGYFFKWKSKENIEIMLQIIIEIVDENTSLTEINK
jgi:general secretion pathway protein D